MTGIYGEKWPRAYGDAPQDETGELTPTGRAWAHGLAGLAGQQIATGIEACIVSASPWVPTLPEFRAACFGVPALSLVQLEFRNVAPRTPFGLAVWALIDGERWRLAPPDKRDHLVVCAYELTREHVIRGGQLPELPAATLEAPKKEAPKPADPAVAARAVATIRELLGDDEAAPTVERTTCTPEERAAAEAELEQRRQRAVDGKSAAAGES